MGRHQPRPAASFLLFFVLFSVCFVFTLPSVSADDEVEISSQDEILADDSLTGTSQAEESADDDDEDEDGDEDEEAIPEDEDEATKSASTGKIEWVETYDGALYEARFGEAGSRWVVLMVQDDSRWTTELLQRLDHSAEAARLARDHFVMAKVTEEDLPTYARLRFNALAPYVPSIFFIQPDGQVRPDLINEFAPEDQDPVYKYFYQTATPLTRMMALVAEKHIPATLASEMDFHEEL